MRPTLVLYLARSCNLETKIKESYNHLFTTPYCICSITVVIPTLSYPRQLLLAANRFQHFEYEMKLILALIYHLILCSNPTLAQLVTAKAMLPEDEFKVQRDSFNHVKGIIIERPYNNRNLKRGWNFLEKRNNYCFSNAPDHYCSGSSLCCTNTALNTGWCCAPTLNCAPTSGCMASTLVKA